MNGTWDDPCFASRGHCEIMRMCTSAHGARLACTYKTRCFIRIVLLYFSYYTMLLFALCWRKKDRDANCKPAKVYITLRRCEISNLFVSYCRPLACLACSGKGCKRMNITFNYIWILSVAFHNILYITWKFVCLLFYHAKTIGFLKFCIWFMPRNKF